MKLTAEESAIVIGLHRMVNEMDRKTKQICKAHGLTLGQFAVLEALYSKGNLAIGQIRDLVLSTDGTIPVIIGNLEKLSFVTRARDAADKRKSVVSLTAAGREKIRQVYPENSQMLKEQLDLLTGKEKERLAGLALRCRPGGSSQTDKRRAGNTLTGTGYAGRRTK